MAELILKSTINKAINICPVSDIKYVGDCPVFSCPANLASLSRGKRTGCYHNLGVSTTLESIALVLDTTLKNIRSRYAIGIKSLEQIISFYNKLKLLQQKETENKTKFCSNCGIDKQTVGNCINKERCKRRLKLVKRALKKYPNCLIQLNISYKDIWREIYLQQGDETFPKIFSDVFIQQSNLLSKSVTLRN